eukprot:6483344-Amphidinium_carterae.1
MVCCCCLLCGTTTRKSEEDLSFLEEQKQLKNYDIHGKSQEQAGELQERRASVEAGGWCGGFEQIRHMS